MTISILTKPEQLTKVQRSILAYCETCIVDHGGLLEGVRMNADDHEALDAFKAGGLLDWGRIPAKLLGEGKGGAWATHWVKFTEAAWQLAAGVRQVLARNRGPYANEVFAEVEARKAEATPAPAKLDPAIQVKSRAMTLGATLPHADLSEWLTNPGAWREINDGAHGGAALVVWQMEDDARAGRPSPECEARAHLLAASRKMQGALTAAEELITQRWGYPDDASSRKGVLAQVQEALAASKGGTS